MRPILIRAALVLAGFALWAGFALVPAGDAILIREAWDRAPYWTIGVPLLLVAQGALAALSRDRAAGLPLWTLAGHFAAMVIVRPAGSDLGLFPLAALFIGVPGYAVLYAVSLIAGKLAGGTHAG